MSEAEKLQAAIERLEGRLSKAHADNLKRGMQDHWLALSFLIGVIIFSAASAFSGIVYNQPKITGVLALLPGILAVAANMLKLQGKADWHDRKANSCARLLGKLRDENLNPTEKDIAEVSKEFSGIQERMQREWKRSFGINFAEFQRP